MLQSSLFGKCLCLFIVVLTICTLLLFASQYLPQEPIDRHVSESVDRLEFEGPYAYILDGRKSAMLDNYTDAIILTVCRSSHSGNPMSFLTNPMFDGADPIGSLAKFCREGAEPDGHYVRYWLGFRIFLRPLLELFSLRGIRFFTLGALFCLSLLAMLSVYKNVSFPAALAFGLSILLIRPYVMSRCMQFACCPLIAVSAMLFIPWVVRKQKRCLPFFMVVGMVTMFFDFYTVPVLTFGMPMIYMLSVLANDRQSTSGGGRSSSSASECGFSVMCLCGWQSLHSPHFLLPMMLFQTASMSFGFGQTERATPSRGSIRRLRLLPLYIT